MKTKKLEAVKNISKENGGAGGLALAYVAAKLLEHYNIPITGEELVLLGGLLTGFGSKFTHLLKDLT